MLAYLLWSYNPGPAMVVSVSSNGRYALSSHLNQGIILWDLKNKNYRVISKHGNIYSAYFIKGTPYFLWQGVNDDMVHVQDINGCEQLSFKNFPTYGHVMTSDLKHYWASDSDWKIYSGFGNQQHCIKTGKGGFYGSGKLLNMSLSADEKLIVTSGEAGYEGDELPLSRGITSTAAKVGIGDYSLLEGVVLWDLNREKPLYKLSGNQAKTIATISPDGKHIVSGDEDTLAFLWDSNSGKRIFTLDSIYHGYRIYPEDIFQLRNNKSVIEPPNDFLNIATGFPPLGAWYAVKFIDLAGHYLFFVTYTRYAVLWDVHHTQPLKYLYLGKDPHPCIEDYSRDSAIDTAPKANILVMAQGTGNGIIVYHFDPKTLSLKKIWAPSI